MHRRLSNYLLVLSVIFTLFLHGDESMLYVKEGGFYIDTIEVSNQQYQEFIAATGYRSPCYWVDNKPPHGYEDAPVVHVNFHDIQQYAEWRNARIPTEEEWEMAAQTAVKENELKNFLDDNKRGEASGGKLPDQGTNVAEWTCTPFNSSDKRFKTIRRGFVEQPCAKIPTSHRAPMFEEDANISTGFRCIKELKPA